MSRLYGVLASDTVIAPRPSTWCDTGPRLGVPASSRLVLVRPFSRKISPSLLLLVRPYKTQVEGILSQYGGILSWGILSVSPNEL